ncbi:HNH endonuclease [Mesorhizobium sp. B2-7-1]|uniref:HNH endonuclease n=1 Tax=Mesorhizobium sp. B2-7-1 TaxID=2589909 RepID=UPI00112B8300|nr:HNH endonuclease [Mesorhizobium sp. B2-7-1]TPJ41050.1 hypothetical protein FJ471_33755 [Mesorhizobium sp. B2-7-1]
MKRSYRFETAAEAGTITLDNLDSENIVSANSPSTSDIKRLFALSGNRCAFPKCNAPMAIGETLVGEICHIKGARLRSSRHDPDQPPEERHAFENLILMCPTHHTVIDDDKESYTVDRLIRLKRDHEDHAKPVEEGEADRVAQVYVESVVATGQSGGFAAHTVHANTITVQTTHSAGHLSSRQMAAVERLWEIVRGLGSEFSTVVFIDSILLPEEMDDYFKGKETPPLMDALLEYKSPNVPIDKLTRAGANEAAKERPFVSPRLWSIYYIIHAIYGRSAFLLGNSFKERRLKHWRDDNGCDQLLRSVLPAQAVDHAKGLSFNGLRTAIDMLESQFLTEAGMNKTQ